MTTNEFSIDKQIECVQREIGMRRRVYPKWIAQGKITQEKAGYEINCMKAVLKTLQGIEAPF